MASTLSQPMILPNSVSIEDWSAAEVNLDIVLIQFYRCKLCNNKFSSLSRSVIVAHMMQVHETEWKVACIKVKEQNKDKFDTIENNKETKKHETTKSASTPKRQLFAKNLQGDSMVPRVSSTENPWKRPATSKLDYEAKIQKTISNNMKFLRKDVGATDNLSNTVDPLIKISSTGTVISNSTPNTPALAVLGVNNGIAYVAKVDQCSVKVGQPSVGVGQGSVSVGKSGVGVGQNIVDESVSDTCPEQTSPDSTSKKVEEIICKHCGYVCSSWNEHWSHSHEHLTTTKNVRYKCQSCRINFGTEFSLEQHQKKNPECLLSKSETSMLSCEQCNFKTCNPHAMRTHFGARHKQKPTIMFVYCTVCNARFNSKRSLRRHRKDGKCGQTKRGRPKGCVVKNAKPRPRMPPKVIVCDLCNRIFDKNSRYDEHYATHFEEKRQKCNECNKAFKTKRSLRQHMVVHKGMKFSCDLCDFRSFWNDSVKKHKELKHFSENLPYHTCNICPYKTKDFSALKAHVKTTHREDKDYICETCGKSFKLASALKCHQEIHNKDAQYPCDKCDYMGTTRFNLYSHKSVHITKDEMQFKCDECTWVGRRSSELTRHKRKHSDNKLFYCHHCGLGYKHRHGLTRHLKEKHMSNAFTTVEISETDESNIYTDDIIVAQVFEV